MASHRHGLSPPVETISALYDNGVDKRDTLSHVFMGHGQLIVKEILT